MKIGIIGAGNVGKALAGHAVRAGHQVVIANSRGPASLTDLVAKLGSAAIAGTVAEAADHDVVLLAVPWTAIRSTVSGHDWNGRAVIDTTNPIVPPDFQIADLGGRTSGEVVADLMPGARVVKAANTLPAAVLASDPHQAGGRRVLALSGDDAAAKQTVAGLFDTMGFASIDLGGLAAGGRLQDVPDGPFPARNLIQIG